MDQADRRASAGVEGVDTASDRLWACARDHDRPIIRVARDLVYRRLSAQVVLGRA